MHKRIRLAVAALAVVGGFALTQAGSASAAHCVNEEGTSPGFSYFGQEGRTEAGNVGNPGASECSPAKNTILPHPSTRAPGQNKP